MGNTERSRETAELMTVTELMTMTELMTVTALVPFDDGCLHPEKSNANDSDFQPWDNPDMLISQKTEWWISTTTNFGLIPFLFLAGGIGNVLSAAVFYRQGLRVRINLCLFSLAVVDQLAVTVIFLIHFEGTYRAFGGSLHFFITYFLGLMGFTWVSHFLSAVIASERCFCVVSPLKAQQMLSTRHMAVFIYVTSALLMGGFLLVVGHKHVMRCLTDPESKYTSLIIYVTDWYLEHKKAFDIIDVFIYSTVIPIVFLTVVMVTTVITAVKLRAATAWRAKTVYATSDTGKENGQQQKLASAAVKEAAVTRMLVATSVLFIVCILPTIMVQIATFWAFELRSGGRQHNLSTALWTLVSLFKVLNSSLNFPVYCVMGSKFRSTMKEVLRCGIAPSKGAGHKGRSDMSALHAETVLSTTAN